jgi:hypothetical protein
VYATPHLPSGALLTYLELDYCDTSMADLHLMLFLNSCDPVLGSCIGLKEITSVSLPGGAPCGAISADLSPLNYTVDNATTVLSLESRFNGFDGTNRLRGVVIGYKLQVSPAPASPTFNDVPLNDLGFQYIEALAASGITGGCGGGNYCPDNPVTRRQIAIFLAKALGLPFN